MTKSLFENPELLALSKRNGNIENQYYGWICVLSKDNEVIYTKGNIWDRVFLRSCLKPIQAIPVIECGLQITKQELAIMCSSHSGSDKHLNILKKLIYREKLSLKSLKCGIHMPFSEKEKRKLILQRKPPSILQNNCSGKHIGMLMVCKEKKWSLSNYIQSSHPLQKHILNKIIELSGAKKISDAIDGCGVTTFSLPIINIARLFKNFAKTDKYKRIIQAMASYPDLIGAAGQLDTEVMKISGGNLIAKCGAEGIIIVLNIKSGGDCLVVKISDGSQKVRSIVVLDMLKKLNWLDEKKIKKLNTVFHREIKNHAGLFVGKYESVL